MPNERHGGAGVTTVILSFFLTSLVGCLRGSKAAAMLFGVLSGWISSRANEK